MTADVTGPVAVPLSTPEAHPQSVQGHQLSGKGEAPPQSFQSHDPALDVFAKIAAERRSRVSEEPVTVPFGNGTIRIYRTMTANWAYLASEASEDPRSAFAAIGEAIYSEDRPRFDEIRKLPPDNAEGIDGKYLLDFLEGLGRFYGGVPTRAS